MNASQRQVDGEPFAPAQGEPEPATRRRFLAENSLGIGAVALATLLHDESADASTQVIGDARSFDMTPKQTPLLPRARAMISLFQHGGPSHVDLFDPKPELTRLHGSVYAGEVRFSFIQRASKRLKASPWKFSPRGQCGMELSELLPELATIADDVCLIRSMHTGANGHEVSIRYFNSGIAGLTGRPSLGSWIVYGLGCASENLPAYLVLTDPGGPPVDAAHNWSGGWMPSLFQGNLLRAQEPRIFNLDPPARIRGSVQEHGLAFLEALNRRHAERYPNEHDLEARIASYELAARMQDAARAALDLSGESASTLRMYGIDEEATRDYGTRCLLARRLVERGVRFVQLFHHNQPWDHHESIRQRLPETCRKTDKPSAALVKDLKQRGMLDEVLVHWGGEIGRLPVTEGELESGGRDHNGQGFSMWLAGGGIRGGMTYGATDEVGHRAAEHVVTPNDYHATLLRLFGIDHPRLTYRHNGVEQRLVANPNARVVEEILA